MTFTATSTSGIGRRPEREIVVVPVNYKQYVTCEWCDTRQEIGPGCINCGAPLKEKDDA